MAAALTGVSSTSYPIFFLEQRSDDIRCRRGVRPFDIPQFKLALFRKSDEKKIQCRGKNTSRDDKVFFITTSRNIPSRSSVRNRKPVFPSLQPKKQAAKTRLSCQAGTYHDMPVRHEPKIHYSTDLPSGAFCLI
jgi:hypothetical protein